MVVDGNACMLDLLDVGKQKKNKTNRSKDNLMKKKHTKAGQEEYSEMRPQWFRGSEGFMLGYAINSRQSFTVIEEWREQILRINDL